MRGAPHSEPAQGPRSRACRPPPRAHPLGLVRSALIGTSSAMALVALAIDRALALDLNTDEGLITDTVASRDRRRVWDSPNNNHAETVSEHSRLEFAPKGIDAGPYRVFPSVGALVVYDDNIFASNAQRQKDVRSQFDPAIKLKSNFARHELDFSLAGKIVSYGEHSDQDYQDVKAQARGALHFDHARTLSAEIMSGLEHEERQDATASKFAAGPVQILHNRASVGITHDVSRLYGTLSASAEQWSYSDVKATDGTTLNESVRDMTTYSGQAKIGYRFSPGAEFVTKLRVSRQFNPGGDGIASRDGWGYEALAGLAFEQGALLRWHVLGGYGVRDFDNAGLSNVGSTLIEAQAAWLAARNLTFYATAKRSVLDVLAADGNDALVESSLAARLEYEVWHNVVLNAGISASQLKFVGSSRIDNRYTGNISLDYHMNKNWLFTIGYEHQVRDSTDDAADMTRNRFTVGAKLRF